MVNYRTGGIGSLALLVDIVVATVGFWIWIALVEPDLLLEAEPVFRYLFYNEVLVVGLIIGHGGPEAATPRLRLPWGQAHRLSARQVICCLFCVSLVLVAFKDVAISRVILFGYCAALYGVLLLTNRWAPGWLSQRLFQGRYSDRVLLVGEASQVGAIRSWLDSQQPLGLHVAGYLAPGENDNPSPAIPCLGGLVKLEDAVRLHGITTVLVLAFSQSQSYLRDCAARCERLGVRLLVVADFERAFQHSVTLFEESGLRLMGLRHEPLESPFNRLLKRWLDVVIALPVSLLILPALAAVVWVVQRVQSPGPLFYVQLRLGMMHQPFRILKFRTMHANQSDPARQATPEDERIYPFGRVLRKFSLDELPQFWNVLEGEMSVIGPRPHLPQHDERFARAMNNYHVRAAIKPGITGLAQVTGFRGATQTDSDIQGRVRADIQYLENWTLALDLWILGKTVGQVIMPPAKAC